ncbi:MAG: TonB-dependent receptor [Candidatus Firestonebacteria bacterium]|nr:TonB-dependent receptor [Candidatus Firestonebacteria bacterium]
MLRRNLCTFLCLAFQLALGAPAGFAQTSGPSLLAPSPDSPSTPALPGNFQRLELSTPNWPALESVLLKTPRSAVTPPAVPKTAAANSSTTDSSRAQVRVSADQIRMQMPLATEDVLHTLPGTDVQSRGPLGIQNDLAVNGSTSSQTLLLLDGMPLRDPQTGHNRLDLPLPPCELETVDLLPGHASSRFGSEAFGGTVNLTTKPAGQGPGEVEFFGGDFKTLGGQMRLPFALGGLEHTFAFNRVTTQGFREDTGAEIFQAGYAAQGALPALPWKLRLGFADKNFGANDFYAAYPSWEHTRTATAAGRARYALAPEIALLPQFSFRHHEDFFLLDVYHPSAFANQHTSQVSSVEVPALWTLPGGGELRLGLEGRWEDLDSSNLGVRQRTLGSGYAFFQSAPLGPWAIDAGLRLDVWDAANPAWSPSLGAAYGLSENWKLRGSAGRAFRLPDFTELYYTNPGNLGNPALAPEKAWVYEAGLDGRPAPGWLSQLTIFRRDEFDVIDWTRAGARDPWQAGNLSRVWVTGVTVLGRWTRAGWDLQADAGLLSLQSIRDETLQSKYQFNYPAQRFQVQAGYTQGTLQPWVHAAYLRRETGAAYWLLDAVLRWQAWEQTSFFVKVTNALNVGYEEIPGVPQPGRWFLGGVDIKFL